MVLSNKGAPCAIFKEIRFVKIVYEWSWKFNHSKIRLNENNKTIKTTNRAVRAGQNLKFKREIRSE